MVSSACAHQRGDLSITELWAVIAVLSGARQGKRGKDQTACMPALRLCTDHTVRLSTRTPVDGEPSTPRSRRAPITRRDVFFPFGAFDPQIQDLKRLDRQCQIPCGFEILPLESRLLIHQPEYVDGDGASSVLRVFPQPLARRIIVVRNVN